MEEEAEHDGSLTIALAGHEVVDRHDAIFAVFEREVLGRER